MLKKIIIILVVSFSVISFSTVAWSSVVGTWEIDGKVTTTIKLKGIKTKKVIEQLNDVWTFNNDNSFKSDNIVGTWSQKKTKVIVYLNDNDINQYYAGTHNDELGMDVTIDQITKKTCTGTENTKKRTIKGSFKIYMNITVYDDICHCNRIGKVTIAGSYTGIPDITDPSVPTGLTVNAVSTSQIHLSWNASSDNIGVAGYKIYRNGSYIESLNSTSTTDTGLSSSTQYCYTVSAYDIATNESNQSSQACATTLSVIDASPPSVPTGLTVNAVSTSQIHLSWNASSDNIGVAGYKIYRNGSYIESLNSTSTTDTGLSSSTQYCYTVSAYDIATNESNQSSQACATTLNPVDENLAKTELLKGKWHFVYTLVSTWTDDYTLSTIDGDKNDQGGYYIYGTDQYDEMVIASYYPDDGYWALLDTSILFDQFYVFYTDGNTILSNSCYYMIQTTGDFSNCYALAGYKYSTATSNSNPSTRKNNKIGILSRESVMSDEVETTTLDTSIEMKYQEMKLKR